MRQSANTTEWGEGMLYSVDFLTSVRKKRGMTQEDLAQALHTTKQNISQYERGLRKPKVKTLFAIAKALNMKLYADNKNEELYFMED